MKAGISFKSTVSAVALSVAIAVPASLAIQAAGVNQAYAAVVNRIEVRGNQRVDAETIQGYLTIQPGASFSAEDIDESVKRLFGTGLFSDVRINQSGGSLVVVVVENQVINQVLFQGNSKIKDAQLAQAVQTKPRGVFSQANLDADVAGIKDAYGRIGRDDATVTAQVIDLGDNRVNVVFEIAEGGRTKIAAINFNGNDAYSDRRLGDVISTKRSNFLSFLVRNDIYDEDRLKADEEALRRFYFNRGYADFQVVSAYGELNEATNEYTVTFTIEEGERYTFGGISIESSIPEVSSESLNSLVETRQGSVYSAKDVEDTIIALTERLAGQGYAFAQVTPRGDRDFENRTISVVYTVDQGPRTYIERIEIRGNTRTRDYVIRREFDVSEGDAFNQVLIQRAKRRLEDLGYFDRVDISTAPGNEADQVILVVDVVDKATGEFAVGGGYSTGGENAGPSVEASVTERNFLGRGQYIRVAAGGGENSRDYSISFTEPYFLGRRISAGFDIFRQTREYRNYESELTGGTVRFGLPITDSISTTLAYNYTEERYNYTDRCDDNGDGVPDAGCDISRAIVDAVDTSPWTKSSISATLLYNTIDDMKNPHSGIYASVTGEFAGLGGEASFAKVSGRATAYYTLMEEADIVGLVSAGGGHVSEIDDGGLRTFDLFKNNERIIRGFEYNGIGPADRLGNGDFDHLGGTTYFHGTVEAQFPMPVVPDSFGLRGAVFADAATVYGYNRRAGDGLDLVSADMEWRAAVGVGLIWASPFGPLRVDYAVPLAKEDSDQEQNFNFGISTKF